MKMFQTLEGIRFFIKTFGCQMNENDSEHIAGVLIQSGARMVCSPEESDLVIVNTCAVRKKSEEKILSFLGRLSAIRKSRSLRIVVAGCMAQIYRNELYAKTRSIDCIVGPHHYHEFPRLLSGEWPARRPATSWSRTWHEFGSALTVRQSPVSAYLPIMEGCNNFCSYCVVPFSRGREMSRPLTHILKEAEDLAASGALEIQLLGQNVNSYRDPETGQDFAFLLRRISRVERFFWIRFITSHPRDIGIKIIQAMVESPKFCRQLHLPLQSGSTAILQRMNRGYTREDYLDRISLLKSMLPGISLSTDLIVGFPGETEADFEDTLQVLREVRFANIFSFCYSPRPRTVASRMADDVPLDVKKKRLIVLQELQKNLQIENNRAFIGKVIKVLGVGWSKKGGGLYSSRNEGFQVVNFSAPVDVRGRFVDVLITSCGPYSLRGEYRG